MKRLLRNAFALAGFDVARTSDLRAAALADLAPADRELVERVEPYTMTSVERRATLVGAIDHIVRHGVQGAIVECGVWRGGSMMLAALALLARHDATRELWMYDTFSGMTAPSEADADVHGEAAVARLARTPQGEGVWCEASLDDVRANIESTGYPRASIRYVQGDVNQTLPGEAPGRIALLRLDTDWYESTRHELAHLYPRVERHGIVIVDDYGYWQGSRKAVDEFVGTLDATVYLHRVDNSGRLIVKP